MANFKAPATAASTTVQQYRPTRPTIMWATPLATIPDDGEGYQQRGYGTLPKRTGTGTCSITWANPIASITEPCFDDVRRSQLQAGRDVGKPREETASDYIDLEMGSYPCPSGMRETYPTPHQLLATRHVTFDSVVTVYAAEVDDFPSPEPESVLSKLLRHYGTMLVTLCSIERRQREEEMWLLQYEERRKTEERWPSRCPPAWVVALVVVYGGFLVGVLGWVFLF